MTGWKGYNRVAMRCAHGQMSSGLVDLSWHKWPVGPEVASREGQLIVIWSDIGNRNWADCRRIYG